MGKPNDLVWDQVCFGASLFDPLGRAFQLPGLRKTFRRPAENSPVSVVPHPQKLPAKASAQAPVASLPSELLAIIAAQHLCADLDAPLAASVCSSFNEVFKGQWPEWEDVRAPGAALQGLLPSIVPVAGGHALLVQQLGGRNLTEFQPCWAFDTAEEREQNPQVYHSAFRRVLESDMKELLDVGPSGWLCGHIIDCYFAATCVPCITTAPAGTQDVYLPTQALVCQSGTKGTTFQLLQSYASYEEVLAAAARFHGVFHVGGGVHFAYFHVVKSGQRLVIFESSTCISRPRWAQFGRSFLVALSKLLDKPGMCSWDVFVLREKAGVPKQFDGKSCGVYSCIVGQHVLQKRMVPRITSPQCILDWRAHIAKTLMESPKAFVPL